MILQRFKCYRGKQKSLVQNCKNGRFYGNLKILEKSFFLNTSSKRSTQILGQNQIFWQNQILCQSKSNTLSKPNTSSVKIKYLVKIKDRLHFSDLDLHCLNIWISIQLCPHKGLSVIEVNKNPWFKIARMEDFMEIWKFWKIIFFKYFLKRSTQILG